MTGAVWKLIIFTSAVNRIINTSSNGRILLLVYDTCLQTFGVCTHGHMAHIEAIVQFLPHSDQHVRCGPALFPLQRHPVVWNCWYQCLMLLGDGGSLLNCRRNSRCTEQLIHASQIAAHKTLSAPESPISLCYVTDRERRGEWDCSWGENLNTCCFVPYGKLTSACVFKAVMADWNRSDHFGTSCIISCSAVPPLSHLTCFNCAILSESLNL